MAIYLIVFRPSGCRASGTQSITAHRMRHHGGGSDTGLRRFSAAFACSFSSFEAGEADSSDAELPSDFFSSERWIVGHSFAARWLTSVDCTDKHSHLWNDWPFLFRDDDISMSYIFTLQTFQELAIKNLDLFFQPKSFAVSYHGSCSISLSDSAFWETIRFPRFLHFIGDSI